MQFLAQKYSDLLTLYHLDGKSVQGRELWVMKISTEKNQRSDLKPMVKYIANMHGNEPTGRELLLAFIEYLVTTFLAGTVSILTIRYLVFWINVITESTEVTEL